MDYIYSFKDSKFDSLSTSQEKQFFIDNGFIKPIEQVNKSTTKTFLGLTKPKTEISKNTIGYSSEIFTEIFLNILPEDLTPQIDSLRKENQYLYKEIDTLRLDTSICSQKLDEVKNDRDFIKSLLCNNIIKSKKYDSLMNSLRYENDSIKSLFNALYKDTINTMNAKIISLKKDSIYFKLCEKENISKTISIKKLEDDLQIIKTSNNLLHNLNSNLDENNKALNKENMRLDSILKVSDPHISILDKIDLLDKKFDRINSINNNPKSYSLFPIDTLPAPILLTTIEFEINGHKIDYTNKNILLKSIDSLKSKGYKKLLIIGYADSCGTTDYNLLLSELRAKTVQVFLFENNIPYDKIETIGVGELSEDKKRKVDLYFYK